MVEAEAWIRQAESDRRAAEELLRKFDVVGRCHAVAKFQQTIEKSVKGLICALGEARILSVNVRQKHDVGPYVDRLIKLPRDQRNRALQNKLRGLLNQNARKTIRDLDDLAPTSKVRRNTEYPFETDSGEWTFPGDDKNFSAADVDRFRSVASSIASVSSDIVFALRRGPNSKRK